MNIKRALSLVPAAIGFPLGSFWRGIQAGLNGRWEGGEHSRYRNRPGRSLESQDGGLNYGLREDMLSEARSLCQTFPICRRIIRKYANHCVGSCRMKWSTGDRDIDKAYAEAWQNWMRIADLRGRNHFRKMSKITVESVLRDGRIYGGLDRRGGVLQVDHWEGDRVSSHGIYNADQDGLVAGHLLDGNGRTRAIRLWQRTIFGTFQNPTDIPSGQFVHVYDSDRADAVTGVTAFHTVLDAIRDLKETTLAERLSAKRNSKLALLVKSLFGGAQNGVGGVDLFNDGKSGAGSATDGKMNVEAVGDVATAYMFPNEEIKAHTSDRPGNGWQWLMEWLVREIAAGLDLPFGVVWHMAGLGGPAARFEIAQANRVFMAFLEDVLEPMWYRPIVGAWLTMEIQQKRLPFIPTWYQFKTPRPAAITIDLGRESKAGIDENYSGLSTATSWYAENDEDFEQETERLGYEAWFRQDVAKRYNVPVSEIRAPRQGAALAAADAKGNKTSQERDEEEPENEPQEAID